MYRLISVDIPLTYKLFSVVKFLFILKILFKYENTLTLIQYCFQGQNEVDPLSKCARIEWNFECISFKDKHSLGLLVKITWNIFNW